MKTKRTQRKNKQKNRKTKKGGDLLGYFFNKKEEPLRPIYPGKPRENQEPDIPSQLKPINPGKKVFDLSEFPEEKKEKKVFDLSEFSDEDDEYETWRDVEGESEFQLPSDDLTEPVSACTETANNCDLTNIQVPNEENCSWLGEGALISILSLANKSSVMDGTELVMNNNEPEKPTMGSLDCDILKSKIQKTYAKFFPYKNCKRFQQIKSFKIYGHFFKKNHLSLVSLSFRLFPNLQKITLGIDPESFELKDGELECLEKQNNIKITIQDSVDTNKITFGKELVATRGELTGGKRKTKKIRKRSKKNKSSKK